MRTHGHTRPVEHAVAAFSKLGELGALWVGRRDDLDFRRPVGQRRVVVQPYTRVNVAAEYGLGRVVLTGSAANVFNDQRQELPGFRVMGRVLFLGLRLAVD